MVNETGNQVGWASLAHRTPTNFKNGFKRILGELKYVEISLRLQ